MPQTKFSLIFPHLLFLFLESRISPFVFNISHPSLCPSILFTISSFSYPLSNVSSIPIQYFLPFLSTLPYAVSLLFPYPLYNFSHFLPHLFFHYPLSRSFLFPFHYPVIPHSLSFLSTRIFSFLSYQSIIHSPFHEPFSDPGHRGGSYFLFLFLPFPYPL